jgi:Ca-activated chloride channel homolog
MNFNQLKYWPILLLGFVLFAVITMIMEKKFFTFIKTYWFYKRSFFSYLSSLLLLLGIGGLVFSLLDVRGPEEKIKMAVPKDRTIILLDTSASMLAEDVKPSRLEKAVLIAKHFSRKAAGHQLSVVAFAEVQKKIVPFTNDIDLIDARLDSLKNLRNQYGSSALSVAIQESIQYFRESDGEARGNILVLTDGEETAEGINLKVPKDVHIALVGIGTSQGGRIPLDDGRGFRFGYKKVQGRDVISKLNESFFKEVVADIPSGKYWLTNNYSLPSLEILDFFQTEKVKGHNEQDMVIKPVLMEWFVVPSLVLLIFAYFIKAFRIFALGMLLIITPLKAQDENAPKLSPEILQNLDTLQKGELNQLERIKLADDLQKAGAKKEALALYEENLPEKIDPNLPPEAYLNYGTSLLDKGETKKGLSVYKNLLDASKSSPDFSKLKNIIDKNTVTHFQQEEQKKKQQKEKKDNKENKDNKEGQSGEGAQNKPQSGDSNKQNTKDKKKTGSEEEEDEQKKEDKKDDKGKGEEEDDKDQEKDSEDEKNQNDQKPMPRKKIPAKLKQLMSDDRQLQMKMIENGTRDLNRRKSRKSKDW